MHHRPIKYLISTFLLLLSSGAFAQQIIKHTVKYGETKYRLSKIYEISIAELERQNPELANGLYAGQVLTIDTSYSHSKEKPDGNYTKYFVQQGETKASIAKKFDITVAQLVQANPSIADKLLAFEYVYVPTDGAPMSNNPVVTTKVNDTKVNNTVEKETTTATPQVVADKEEKTTWEVNTKIAVGDNRNKYADLKASAEFGNGLNLTFLYPEDISNKKEYEDFDRGAQLAIDSINSLGGGVQSENVNLTYVAGTNLSRLKDITNVITLCNVKATESVVDKSKSKVNTAFAITTDGQVKKSDNLTLFSKSTDFYKQKALLDYINQQNGNIIIISDADKKLSNDIKNSYVGLKVIKVAKNEVLDNDELYSALSDVKTNFVILNTTDVNTILSVTNSLLPKYKSYAIHLASFNSYKNIVTSKISVKRYVILNFIFPEYEGYNVKSTYMNQFVAKYNAFYNEQPSEEAISGFDITFDFLLRLSQKENMDAVLEKSTKQVVMPFEYSETSSNVFVNRAFKIYQLTDQETVKQLN